MWSPELWHPDNRSGKLRKRRFENEEKSSEEEPMTITAESEQPMYSLPPSTLLPVEEEQSEDEDEDEDESQIIFS